MLSLISNLRQNINNEFNENAGDKNLIFLQEILKKTNYGSIIWSSSDLDQDLGSLIINEIKALKILGIINLSEYFILFLTISTY